MAFPTDLIASASIVSIDTTRINTSLSGRESRSQQSTQYWEMTANTIVMDASERRSLLAHIATSRGQLNSFEYTPPFANNDSTYSSTITVNTAAAAGSTGISVKSSVNPSGQVPIKAGEFLKFSNHSKVYMATADLTLTLSGGFYVGTLAVYPGITTALTTSHTVTYTTVPFTFRLASDPGLQFDITELSVVTLDFKEDIV
jgi:hypothetical protein